MAQARQSIAGCICKHVCMMCMYAGCISVCICACMHVCIQMRVWLVKELGQQRMMTTDSIGQRIEKVLHVRHLGQPSASGHRQLCITVQGKEFGEEVLQLLWGLWVPTSAELSREQSADSANWRWCAVRWMRVRAPRG